MCSVYVSVERSGNGAERAENKVSGSETVSGLAGKCSNGSGAWSGSPQSGSGAERECHKYRLER